MERNSPEIKPLFQELISAYKKLLLKFCSSPFALISIERKIFASWLDNYFRGEMLVAKKFNLEVGEVLEVLTGVMRKIEGFLNSDASRTIISEIRDLLQKIYQIWYPPLMPRIKL